MRARCTVCGKFYKAAKWQEDCIMDPLHSGRSNPDYSVLVSEPCPACARKLDEAEAASIEADQEREAAWEAQQGEHHPDCQCDVCYYGADAAKWLNNPSEY